MDFTFLLTQMGLHKHRKLSMAFHKLLVNHYPSSTRIIKHVASSTSSHLCHHQHQCHLISNVVININVISSQISSSTSISSHLNIVININIISFQYHHQHHKKSHSTYNTCLRFTFPRSSDNIHHIS